MGKSRSAAEKCVSSGWSLYYRPIGQGWGGSSGQQAVVLDDFYG